MPALSLRLPEELEQRLDEEARQEGVPRSEVARAAISDYLARRERERFMAELVAEARSAYANDRIRDEALALAENFLLLDDEAAPTSDKATDNESWWK